MEPHGTVYAQDPECLPPGTELGAWRVLELSGKGAYGVVYRVEPIGEEGGGPFALKLALHPEDPRFAREVELLSRIRHPNVPKLEGRGLWEHPEGPFPFIVMEWREGVALYDWVDEHKPSWRQVMRVLAQVARALEATHAVEGVHRDVKGNNVLVRAEGGKATLLDFGVGDFRGAPTLTREVVPPGTSQYQSPEGRCYQWLHWDKRGAHYAPVALVRSGSQRSERMWAPGLAVAVALGAFLAFLAWRSSWRQGTEWPEEAVAQQSRDGAGEDAGTTGLGEDALTASARVESPEASWKALTLQMPKKPLPGQKRPPCKRDIEIKGGCWGRPENSKPPCDERYYEWEGVCYYPVLAPIPPSTSETPE